MGARGTVPVLPLSHPRPEAHTKPTRVSLIEDPRATRIALYATAAASRRGPRTRLVAKTGLAPAHARAAVPQPKVEQTLCRWLNLSIT